MNKLQQEISKEIDRWDLELKILAAKIELLEEMSCGLGDRSCCLELQALKRGLRELEVEWNELAAQKDILAHS